MSEYTTVFAHLDNFNKGQACIASSRLILHQAIADEFLENFIALSASIRVGDPLAEGTEMGPLTSALHRDRVLEYVGVSLVTTFRVT